MSEPHLLVLCTLPDRDSAVRMAEAVVDRGLAACVSIVPGLTSIYRWQGKRESGEELLLLIKTRESVYEALQTFLAGGHPYELPEIIAVPITRGLPDYLAWIDTNTGVER
jgi:periplasmic divalent cation tolerance protein